MAEYSVEWIIEVMANNPEEAARIAREIQLTLTSTATIFKIVDLATEKTTWVDIWEEK